MRRRQWLRVVWQRFWLSYRRRVMRPDLVRVDPATLLLVLGVVTTLWGIGVGTGTAGEADSAVDQLLGAPAQLRAQLDQQLADERIDPYIYNARMEQIDQLEGLFRQYAALYQERGDEVFNDNMVSAMCDMVMSLNPATAAAGKAGGLAVVNIGKPIDRLYSAYSTANGIRGTITSLRTGPFEDIDRRLAESIHAILGGDLEPFFEARMRGKVNELKNTYFDLQRQYPDDPAAAECEYRRILQERAQRLADVLMLTGQGGHWATDDDFRAWLDGLVMDAVIAEGPDAALFPDADDAGDETVPRAGTWVMTLESGPAAEWAASEGVAASMVMTLTAAGDGQSFILSTELISLTMTRVEEGVYVLQDGPLTWSFAVVDEETMTFQTAGGYIADQTLAPSTGTMRWVE